VVNVAIGINRSAWVQWH